MQDDPDDLAPTPTQAENDKAKLGGREPEVVEDAAKDEVGEGKPKPDVRKASREAKAGTGATYETR